MIELKSKTEFYEKYESEDNVIMLALLDGKPRTVTIQPKRYPYPTIACYKRGDIRFHLDGITVSHDTRERFEENCKKAWEFIDNELTPFLEEHFYDTTN